MSIVGSKAKIMIFREQYLGRGLFGYVIQGSYASTNVAVKRIIRYTGSQDERNFMSEINLIKKAKHLNIVECIFDDEDDNFFYIVMKKCRCSLQAYLAEFGYSVMQDSRLQMFYHAATGLTYLHSVGILHRNIKMSNLLLFEVDSGVIVQISDFGFSKTVEPDQTSTEILKAGTAGYTACEVLNGKKMKPSSDVFSLGIIFHEMLTDGKHPFSNDVDNKNYCIQKLKPADVRNVKDSDLRLLIKKMIAHTNRPTSASVKEELLQKHLGQKVSKINRIQAETDLEAPIEAHILFSESFKFQQNTSGPWVPD